MRILIALLLSFLLIFLQASFAQDNRQLQGLREYLKANRPPGYDSTLNYVNYIKGTDLHYLYPLYQLIREEDRFKKILSIPGYYDELSQALACNGDYTSSLEYLQKGYDSVVDEVARRQINKVIQGFKNVQHADARRYISFLARNYQVVMINEAHNKPQHRAFVLALLDDMYKKGFRYLAMEMLNNYSNRSPDKLTPLTGHYCSEPVAGELVRTAIDMGFRLVPYEDTAADIHTATQRDSIQALNIYKIILADSTARILVLGGYAHIAEKNISNDYIPMGMAFKKISGIDPLTIDQVNMTEGSDFTYGKVFYDAYTQKFSLTSPSIALIDEQPVDVTSSNLYDLCVIHPPTIYKDSRPGWLNLNGRRQPLYIKPSNKNTFLAQAYYQFESFSARPGQVIPADQTYIPTSKGNYLLYLRRGKYIVVFRDMQYKTLNTLHVEVD